jgi:hypothetical protein
MTSKMRVSIAKFCLIVLCVFCISAAMFLQLSRIVSWENSAALRQKTHKTIKQNLGRRKRRTRKRGRPDKGGETVGSAGAVEAAASAVATAVTMAKLSQYGEDPGTTGSYTHRARTGFLARLTSKVC